MFSKHLGGNRRWVHLVYSYDYYISARNATCLKQHVLRSYIFRALARFFVMGGGGEVGGIIESAYGKSLVGGSGGKYPPPENFQIWRLRNAIFSTCHEICLRKIDLEIKMAKNCKSL